MRIWCCSCFTAGEDEAEEERFRETAMREGAENEGNPETIVGNDDEFEDVGRLGLAVDRPAPDDQAQLRLFEEMVRATRGHCEVGLSSHVLNPWKFQFWVSSQAEGESSNSSAPVSAIRVGGNGNEECDLDPHHKRAKVHSDSCVCSYSPTFPSDAGNTSCMGLNLDIRDGSLVTSKNESVYQTITLINAGGGFPFGSSSGKDEIKGIKTEDFEIRMDLTDDLLHMVFSFLDHINLCRAAIVCRQWRVASAHEDFWRCLDFENRNISVDQFEDMCQRYPKATEVNISGAPAIHLLVMKAVASLRNLEILTLGRGILGDTFFHALADCQTLKKLTVNDSTLGNCIQEIPINHDRLRHLHLTKCRVIRISVRCPQLETLSLKRSNMAQAILNCPLLRDLDIGSCHKLSDAAIRSAATSCPQLESLDVSNCSCISDETIHEIASTCANLHILNASYCPNISLESVALAMLTVLKLHSCEGITSASMLAISRCSMLEVLELDNCSLLTSVSLDLQRLQSIRLVHCRKFADLNLRSLVLSSIMVSNCPALHRVNITSNALQKLALQNLESLTTLALQCQSLQEVDLTDCESLWNSICDIFGDDGGCPMLKSLVLDNCVSLTAVQFCSTSLVNLSLVGCRAITTLQLTCPFLERVCLDGCDHLEVASFFPVGLKSLNLGICPKLNELRIKAPHMAILELKGCGGLSEASIDCPLLSSLDASFCGQLRDDCLSATTASCPLIESLILMSCQSVGSDGLYSLGHLPRLIILDLSYTFLMNLHPVFESCLQLKVLKLQACKYLTDSSLEPLYKEGALPALQELDLSYGTFRQSSIEELLTCCTHLTHVSLNGCVNMHDLNWSYHDRLSELNGVDISSCQFSVTDVMEPTEQADRLLQNLNCVGCPNIRKVLIPPTARCSYLSSLNLSLSSNLKEVDVACLNLCFLNLRFESIPACELKFILDFCAYKFLNVSFSNCCSLQVLRLDCPKLSSLFLQSCNINEEAVETAIAKCSMLETLDVRFCPKISSMSMIQIRMACSSLKRIFSSLLSSS